MQSNQRIADASSARKLMSMIPQTTLPVAHLKQVMARHLKPRRQPVSRSRLPQHLSETRYRSRSRP